MTEAHAKLFRCRKLLQILSPCVSGGGETAGGGEWSAVAGGGGRRGEGRQYTGRENLEQFPMTES